MKKIWILVRKEIVDILRDKKTLVMMVLVPVLLYPLLLIGMTLIFSAMLSESEESAVLEVRYPAGYEEVASALDHLQDPYADTWLLFVAAEDETEMDINAADALLRLETDEDGNLHAQISYLSADSWSLEACAILEELLEEYRQELVDETLLEAGLSADVLFPVIYETEDQSTLSESFGSEIGSTIGGMLGMLLITTILLGAMYPSIDAMAGERERGTLETLLTLPVTNFQIIMSKYISVAFFACVTAVISLLSLGGSVLFIYFGLIPGTLSELQGVSILSLLPVIPMVLLTLLVTALLVTALCMCFCVFARSFKEANNYITPAMLVVMVVSMVGIVPSVTLDTRTALIPIANVSLLIKDLTSQTFSWPLAALTMAVNFGYSVIIVWILSKLYNSEAVLFSDGLGSFRIFRKRSEIRPGTMPAIGDVTIAVIVLLLLMLYAGSALTLRSVTGGTVLTQLLILVIPLLLTWYLKSDTETLFQLKRPRLSAVPGTILLYVGAYFTGISLSLFVSVLFPQSMENLEDSYSSLLELSIWILLLIMAVLPAIGEELLFRGLIFGTLRIRTEERIDHEKNAFHSVSADAEETRMQVPEDFAQARLRSFWLSIGISSLIFAAFHMSLVKLPSTFLLGAAFAYADYMGGSIFLSMGLHFLNNTVSVLVMKYPEQVSKWAPILTKESFTLVEVIGMLAGGIVCVVVGMSLLRRGAKDQVDL